MQSGWKKPLVWRCLLGLAGTVLFVVFAFHQPWIPVEITPAETGVLGALAAESRGIVEPASPTDVDLKPVAVPVAQGTGKPKKGGRSQASGGGKLGGPILITPPGSIRGGL